MFAIIDGSCHEYHFLSRQTCVCQDKTRLLSRQKGYLWQLTPMIATDNERRNTCDDDICDNGTGDERQNTCDDATDDGRQNTCDDDTYDEKQNTCDDATDD